jgi:hypothetical protein
MAKLSKKKVETYYIALGRFVTVWADVEVFLDLLVLILRKDERKLPHQLSRKIAFINRQLKVSQSPHATAIMRLVGEIDGLADTRHDYVHGSMIVHTVTRSNLTVTLARLLQPQKQSRRPPAKVTAEQITDTADRLYKIGDELLELVAAVNAARTVFGAN